MLTIRLTADVVWRIKDALERAGEREIGGVLFAEHIGVDEFTIREVTIHRRGGIAFFVRRISEALQGLRGFFAKTANQYTRFNYLGEWHSHPLFAAEPSGQDDASMREIVEDENVGANFVVLLVLKLGHDGELTGGAHTYLPDGRKSRSILKLEGLQ